MTDKFSTEIIDYADNYFDLLEANDIESPHFKKMLDLQKNSYMQNDIKVWLYDILNAIMEIDTFMIEIDGTFEK